MKKTIFALFLTCYSISFAQKVLQIGDSHTVGPFGKKLYQELTDAGFQARSIGLAGSSGKHWSSDKESERKLSYGFVDRGYNGKGSAPVMGSKGVSKLSTYIQNDKPDIVIIELGDNFASYSKTYNDLNNKSANAAAINEINLILNQLEKAQFNKSCYWVGPLWTNKDKINTYKKTNARAQVVAELIKNTISKKCHFINSQNLLTTKESETVSDGLHFKENSGALWGRKAADAIIQDIYSKKKNTQTKSASSKQ